MSVILDILASIVVAAIIIFSINGLTVGMQKTVYEGCLTYSLQTNVISVAEVFESDLYKIGYHAPRPAILVADSTRLIFTADLRNDGHLDSVAYYIGNAGDPAVLLTRNPNDRPLVRVLNGSDTISMGIGLSRLHIAYFDSTGASTSSVSAIKSIQVKMMLESPEPLDSLYQRISWEKTIFPHNL